MTTSKRVFLIFSKQPECYDTFTSLLIGDGWHVISLIDIKQLAEYSTDKDGVLHCLGILNSVERSFTADELSLLTRFHHAGHSLLVAGSESENQPNSILLNDFTARFGIVFNEECIIRPNLYKHYHPKEAVLRDFVVNRGFSEALKKYWKAEDTNEDLLSKNGISVDGPALLYPHGCSLKVSRASIILMTSSQWATPCRQAICALHNGGIRETTGSRVIVIGSSLLFSEKYINKEDNKAIIRTLLEYIVNKDSPINVSDAKTVEIPEVIHGPDVEALLETPISCIQESERLPEDKMSLVNKRLFSIDGSKLPLIVRAYRDLNVPNERLTLIKPELQFGPLKLEPATHGFLVRRPPN